MTELPLSRDAEPIGNPIFQTIQTLLSERRQFINRTLTGTINNVEFTSLMLISSSFLFAYGFILGWNHSLLQAISAAIKLPLLYVFTSLICFPTLYFFLSILGMKQSIKQLFTFGIAVVAIIAITQLVFAPISLFFIITSNSYVFYKLLNIGIFCVSGMVGLSTYYRSLSDVIAQTDEPADQRKARLFLKIWLLLFAFIGSQLSWSLSPFFGYPDAPFILINEVYSNFYVDVWHTIISIFRY